MGSRKISKIKFIEAKVQKVFEEFDKLEYCGLTLNQMIRVLICYILSRLNYMFEKIDIPVGILDDMDCRIRRIVNRFLKGQTLQKSYFYIRVRNGGFGVPNIKYE
jgi:hypothetical protein